MAARRVRTIVPSTDQVRAVDVQSIVYVWN